MKVIFLDIDGVINLDIDWCEESINVLNKLINITDSKIVITSDWRYDYSLTVLRNIFEKIGVQGDIIDAIDLQEKPNLETNQKDRIIAIINYIKKHNLTDYVVIDDMNLDKFDLISDRFVKTNFSKGLKEDGLLEKCIKILKKQ